MSILAMPNTQGGVLCRGEEERLPVDSECGPIVRANCAQGAKLARKSASVTIGTTRSSGERSGSRVRLAGSRMMACVAREDGVMNKKRTRAGADVPKAWHPTSQLAAGGQRQPNSISL